MSKSVYKYASEGGVPVGMCLTAMSACFLLSLRHDMLLLAIPLLGLLVPWLMVRTMRTMAEEEPSYGKFAPLWLCGIYTVIFGTLICSLLSGLWLSFVDPGFITAYVENAIEVMRQAPGTQYEQTVRVMEQALERHMLPNGMELVASLGWTTCFAGCLLSLALAWGVASRRRRSLGNAFK